PARHARLGGRSVKQGQAPGLSVYPLGRQHGLGIGRRARYRGPGGILRRLNAVVANYDVTIVCTYDCAKFSGRTIVDVLRCHPLAIIGGLAQVNPYFVPPEALLQELQRGKHHIEAT
ncbi:MAG: MEDS domain-containing protein, partial [Gammaproteobacteria bacterium]